jgi:hypothetical protein
MGFLYLLRIINHGVRAGQLLLPFSRKRLVFPPSRPLSVELGEEVSFSIKEYQSLQKKAGGYDTNRLVHDCDECYGWAKVMGA